MQFWVSDFFLSPLSFGFGDWMVNRFLLKLVVIYVDFKLDESYTPSKISIRAGDGFHNLKVTTAFLARSCDFEAS